MTIGISYIDVGTAKLNLDMDIPMGASFDDVLNEAKNTWMDALTQIEVTDPPQSNGPTQIDRTKFYSSLYRSFKSPTLWTESDGRYFGFDKSVHNYPGFNVYTDLSIWDIFRTEFPLLVLLKPDVAGGVVQSLLLINQQTGRLPKWPLNNGDTGDENAHSLVIFF
jgi:putative alpha-1,2-mannosidase